MKNRYHILRISNAPDSFLRGKKIHTDEHGRYVIVDGEKVYTELTPYDECTR